ncbi:MAG: L-fucose:H+ symporter permease [Lacipirellulaceae bacterium]
MSDAAVDVPSDDKAVVPSKYFLPFCLVTSLFALWGFANDYTNPLVKMFGQIFQISDGQSAWVQAAFYGGYATMAIPAALVIRKFSYKFGIVVGLILFAAGALITIPASIRMEFNIFLISFYILTFGLAFLETAANPYILAMGPRETATRRLNLAQAFNPIGSLTGMAVASLLILPQLEVNKYRESEAAAHPEYKNMLPSEVNDKLDQALTTLSTENVEKFGEMKLTDLATLRTPYVILAIVVITVLVTFLLTKMPAAHDEEQPISLGELIKKLSTFRYLGGVVAQAVYVGAQITCWTFIIHYGMTYHGMSASQAQNWNIAGMIIFLCSRFICTFILQYLRPGLLLGILATVALGLTLGVIYVQSIVGMYCLIGISACMSLMFPTIYGIALDGLTPDDAKLGSAGLIFAIVGGALMPKFTGNITDQETVNILGSSLPGLRAAFFLPAAAFVFVAIYGFLMSKQDRTASPS